MPRQALSTDPRYDSLPFPIRNAGKTIAGDPEIILKTEAEFLGSKNHANKRGLLLPRVEYKIFNTGSLQILASRTTPCIMKERSVGECSTLALSFAGGNLRFKEGSTDQLVCPGDIHLNPYDGKSVNVGYLSALITKIDHRQLKRTIQAISGKHEANSLGRSVVIKSSGNHKTSISNRRMWSFISLIDQLLGESNYLPMALGLGEQIFRLLALALLETDGTDEKLQRRWSTVRHAWKSPFDELVDYIRINAHLNLTLTDLEEQSHYSARHLQNLFREKFDCTPMQFVRRQRLSTAMEKLQTADWDETVTSIGRDCGYRFTSNFSTDFHREFGVAPSVVLRASKGKGGGGDYDLMTGPVQCSQRRWDASWAGNTACQTLHTPAAPWQPLKFWQLMQRGATTGAMCDSRTTVHCRAVVHIAPKPWTSEGADEPNPLKAHQNGEGVRPNRRQASPGRSFTREQRQIPTTHPTTQTPPNKRHIGSVRSGD